MEVVVAERRRVGFVAFGKDEKGAAVRVVLSVA